MYSNPIYDKKKKEPNVYITYVVRDYESINSIAIDVKKYALEEGVKFSTRVFNSDMFWEDKNYVESLPAFHIYIKKITMEHKKTFYPTSNYVKEIDTVVKESIAYEERRKTTKTIWKKILTS
jgi:hypothetical protein